MKALLCTQWGPPESLVVDEVERPKVGPGQVLIRVRAAGVNFPDTLIIQNRYQFKPALPFSPGGECAGVVEALGANAHRFQRGDRVIAFTAWGAFAEYVSADEDSLIAIPDGLDDVTASALAMTYGTAYHALADRAALKPGETILVLGASGGVGLASVEVAKALGARVIAAASSAAKLAVCREHGADELIDYSIPEWREQLKALTGGRGVDVVCDPVGGPFTEAALRSCAWRGRLLVIGFANGDIPKLPANLMLLKGCSVVGVFLGEYLKREPAQSQRDLVVLLDWLRDGRIRPRIADRYPLARGGEAIRRLMDRNVVGKVVVEVP